MAVVCWVGAAKIFGQPLGSDDFVACLLMFLLTFPGRWTNKVDVGAIIDLYANWLFVAGLLVLLGVATDYIHNFEPRAIMLWGGATPLIMAMAYQIVGQVFDWVYQDESSVARAVVVGYNETGRRLAGNFEGDSSLGMRLLGVFDDRSVERLGETPPVPMLGGLGNVASYVKEHQVSRIYIALPMASQPRILKLLDDLRDTTASIYFVPDYFVFDLIQARLDRVKDIPVVAVCETPFYGMNQFLKRCSDILLSSLILLGISPIMLLTALAIKLESKGPVFFNQRRYGLDGRDIMVYKFRSMSVMEDGDQVYKQVTRNDSRVTRVGAFIRKTSIDELPQFLNVLQGRMSIVGPRPHAVAVNEQYRKLIPGYMVRHKVKPGITGWAQVNGYRGGDDLEHMTKRVEFDLEYLRNWSLRLDIAIIMRTVLLVFKDARAY
ncbi:undecaprenyl-phosphate glucose phosphotransferase [Chitinivorax sp. PXF-14]|uniref:undecaprenyl-phosphate glucose phosphotransferase n=1 Tax=Chitinivorax sp. PXF-14 TaxID=3230488 RepID=UPI00346697AE